MIRQWSQIDCLTSSSAASIYRNDPNDPKLNYFLKIKKNYLFSLVARTTFSDFIKVGLSEEKTNNPIIKAQDPSKTMAIPVP